MRDKLARTKKNNYIKIPKSGHPLLLLKFRFVILCMSVDKLVKMMFDMSVVIVDKFFHRIHLVHVLVAGSCSKLRVSIKLRLLETTNQIFNDSNSDSNKFGRQLRYESDTKTTIESTIAIEF